VGRLHFFCSSFLHSYLEQVARWKVGGWVRQAATNALTGVSHAAWSSKPLQASIAPHLNIVHAPVQRMASLLGYSACLVWKIGGRNLQLVTTKVRLALNFVTFKDGSKWISEDRVLSDASYSSREELCAGVACGSSFVSP
jgi:hypothetical protein